MNWQLLVSLRYLTSKRKERFISVISLISILGVAVGVFSLIVVISVMSGFDEDLKNKIIGTYSHIEVLSDYGMKPTAQLADKILKTEHVAAISFFMNGQALARYRDKVTGVIAKGIVPKDEVKVNNIGRYLKEGTLDFGGDGAVIGSELAGRLGAKTGDTISLVSPAYTEGRNFRVSGIFTSGMYEYDMNLVYVDISKAQDLFGVNGMASGVAVKLDDVFNVAAAKSALQSKLGYPFAVRTWIDSNRNLIEALKLEKTVMFIILTLIVTVACFNIASALIMTVLEKTKDIGILKAIGARNQDIMAIFAMQGGAIGVLGTFIGAALGISACWCLGTYKFITLPKDIYYIDKLPVRISFQDISVIIMASIAISFFATLYPAYKASRLDPVEALRYE